MTDLLFMKSLSFSREDKLILSDQNLQLKPGSSTAVIGLSGVGKSTFLRLLSGLKMADQGSVSLGDQTTSDLVGTGRVAMVFQELALWPAYTVEQHLRLVMKEQSEKKSFDYRDCLRRLGLQKQVSQRPDTLSGGQQQRLAFARALAQQPDVLLLDEAFSQSDALYQLEMWSLVEELRVKNSTIVVYATHDLTQSLSYCDQTLVLAKGVLTNVEKQDIDELMTLTTQSRRARLKTLFGEH